MKIVRFIAIYFVVINTLYAQDEKKNDTTILSNSNYKLVKVDLESGLLTNTLPLDEFVVLFAENNLKDSFNGCFTIWQKTANGKCTNLSKEDKCNYKIQKQNICKTCPSGETICLEKFYTDTLRITEKGIYAFIPKYFRPNNEYIVEFNFNRPLPAATKTAINDKVIEFYIKSSDELLKNNGFLNEESIDELRLTILNEIPKNYLIFIKPNSLLDLLKKFTLQNYNASFANKIIGTNDNIKEIETITTNTITQLENLLSSENLSKIDALYSKSMGDSLRLLNVSKDFKNDLIKGRRIFSNKNILNKLNISKLDEDVIDNYIKNINKNKVMLESLFRRSDFISSYTFLDIVLKNMTENIVFLNFIKSDIKTINTIQKRVIEQNLNDFIEETLTFNASSFANFVTSAKSYVSADLGALVTNFTGEADKWRVVPYLGMNLYLVPVNKNAPYKYLYDNYKLGAILRALSLHVGITIPKIAEPTYQGVFQSQSDSRAFILGLGIRTAQSVRLSYGYIFINRSVGNPLSTSFNISARPYFSISLDWDLRKLIPTIKDLVN